MIRLFVSMSTSRAVGGMNNIPPEPRVGCVVHRDPNPSSLLELVLMLMLMLMLVLVVVVVVLLVCY